MNEEIYPNAPIVLMVAEIKHTEHGPLDEKQSRTISEAVRETLPIREEDAEQNITFTGITDGTQPPVQVSQTKVLRWSSRDRRTVLTVKSDTISVETTQYHRYMDIRELLGRALAAPQVPSETPPAMSGDMPRILPPIGSRPRSSASWHAVKTAPVQIARLNAPRKTP